MTKPCECGLADHKDQIEKFPLHSTVKFYFVSTASNLTGRTGTVMGHCEDGRAVIVVDGLAYTHTFHYPPCTVVGAPVADVAALQAQMVAQAAEIERLTTENKALRLALAESEFKLSTVWPGTWQPITEEDTELIDPGADDDRRLYIDDYGTGIEFTCDSGELEGYFNLPDGYAVCRRVQP